MVIKRPHTSRLVSLSAAEVGAGVKTLVDVVNVDVVDRPWGDHVRCLSYKEGLEAPGFRQKGILYIVERVRDEDLVRIYTLHRERSTIPDVCSNMATESTSSTSPRLFQFRNIGRRRSPSSPTFEEAAPPNPNASQRFRSASLAQHQQASPSLSLAASQPQPGMYPPSPSSPTGGMNPFSSSAPPTAPTTTTTNPSRTLAYMLRRSSNRQGQQQSQQRALAATTGTGMGTGGPTASTTQGHNYPNTTTNNEAPAPPNPNPALNATMPPSSNAVNANGHPTANQSGPVGSGQQHGVQLQNPRPLPGTVHRIRLVPHLESSRSLPFEPIIRDAIENGPALRVGRFTDRQTAMASAPNAPNALKIAFRSKVVSRGHAEIWVESGGKVCLRAFNNGTCPH